METFAKVFGTIVLALLVLTVFAVVIALPVMLIVNYLFTSTVLLAVFGIPALTFWKAFWLNWLCGILFKATNTSK